jgi:6-phosphofructokinase
MTIIENSDVKAARGTIGAATWFRRYTAFVAKLYQFMSSHSEMRVSTSDGARAAAGRWRTRDDEDENWVITL